MGQQIHCIPDTDAGCALSVQKIYFYFTDEKTVVYSSQTLYWQGFPKKAVKRMPGNGFRKIYLYWLSRNSSPFR